MSFFSTKVKDPSDSFSPDHRYILENNGQTLVAQNITNIDDVNAFFFTTRAIKLGGEVDLSIPSPYNTSFVTYNKNGSKVDTTKSIWKLK